ncbi:hypothetical protein [Escherichia coli]|uniref:hypothetical protein n=1 Tax=Escherichia coli TaxID=562 RepID=UPI00201A59E0|nr:hypothetical protein [Escherichia coli]
MTFVAISDTHLHNWSQFAIPTESGINSRLLQILKAIEEAAFFPPITTPQRAWFQPSITAAISSMCEVL